MVLWLLIVIAGSLLTISGNNSGNIAEKLAHRQNNVLTKARRQIRMVLHAERVISLSEVNLQVPISG